MAGTLQFVGFNDLNFGPITINTGPTGTSSTFRVDSPNVAALINYHNYVISHGANCKLTGIEGSDTRTLEVEVPGLTTFAAGLISELYFDRWELLTNESSDTIFANPLIVGGATPVLNYNDRVVLSRATRDGGTLADAIDNCNADITDGNLIAPNPTNGGTSDGKFQKPSSAAAAQLTIEVMKTQTEYERPTRVLRHTSYCSAGATYNSSVAGEELIYSPSQLLTEVGSGWTYNLPGRLYSKIASIPTQYAPANEATYYTWGWLKRFSREAVLANFMVEVSTEYVLDLWSNLRYGLR